MSISRLLPNTADHYRPIANQDVAGGWESFPALIGRWQCSIQPRSVRRYPEIQGREGATISHAAYFAADYGFALNDRLIPTSGSGVGKTYVCQGPAKDQAGRGQVWVVDLIQVV
jgi:hypothetical protein